MTNGCIIMDGNAVAERVLVRVSEQAKLFTERAHRMPLLVVVLFGSHPASLSYIKKKELSARGAGIEVRILHEPDTHETKQAAAAVKRIQVELHPDGLIVQLPVPEGIDVRPVLEEIDPAIDVDCLTATSLGLLAADTPSVVPPTPGAILELLSAYNLTLDGKHIVVVGHGPLVGKPLSILLTQKRTTVTVCNEFTQDLPAHTRQADVLIAATGVRGLITGDHVKPGATVIDAGTTVVGTKVAGDIDQDTVCAVAGFLSPVPGGVGPVTVSKLLENVVEMGLRRFPSVENAVR